MKTSKASNKQKAANMVHSKVRPVVVKHVLPQNFIQKPEVYQDRPVKQLSLNQ